MRPIIFRGRCKWLKHEWLYGSLLFTRNRYFIVPSDWNGTGLSGYEVIVETVGQLTGLLDKNGKETYEGDIMPLYENGIEYYYKVLYDGDCFMLGMLDSKQGSYPLSIKSNISQIIGNIHDNPKLLKATGNPGAPEAITAGQRK